MQNITNICALHYVPISELGLTDIPLGGPARVEADWTELPTASGASLIITESQPTSGRQYKILLRATLKSSVLIKSPVLIRVTLSDDTTLLIGDADFPVRLLESHALAGKDISLDHNTWHYPYQVISYDTGSGSTSGGL